MHISTRTILIGIGIILLGLAIWWIYQSVPPPTDNTPPQSYPVTTTTRGESDLIRLHTPKNNQTITSPLTISGTARGNWFFEDTFPIVLTDWDGKIIAQGYASADGEWMTTEYVPFTATLPFTTPEYGERGSLILQKNNASGLPQHDDAVEITVRFAQ